MSESPDTVRRRYRLLTLLRQYERLPAGGAARDAVLSDMMRLVRTQSPRIALMEGRVAREQVARDDMAVLVQRAPANRHRGEHDTKGAAASTTAAHVENEPPTPESSTDDETAPEPAPAVAGPRVESDTKYGPRDLPDLRVQMVQFWDSREALDWLDVSATMDEISYTSDEKPSIARLVRQSVAQAELFHLDRPLSRIVDRQPVQVHDYGFMPWDLPSPYGFLYLSEVQLNTADETPMPGVLSWASIENLEGWPRGALDVFVHMDKDTLREQMGSSAGDRFDRELPPFVLTGAFTVGFAERGEEIRVQGHPHRTNSFTPRLFSACHLMRQSGVVEDFPEHPSRPQRRRAARLGVDTQATRVINLRRSKRPAATGETEAEWHHRWIVRGHWRRQWYPSLEAHRPKWIDPFVKGSRGPMLRGEKVHRATAPDAAGRARS